jgi:hypothetical protein
VRQRIGIAFASLAVAMFGVALIASLNDSSGKKSNESSVVVDQPIPTDFLDDLNFDEASPAPSSDASTSSSARRSTSRGTSAAKPAAKAAAPAPTEDHGMPPPGYFQNTCNGNGSDGDNGGGGGGCGGGAPGAPPPQDGNVSGGNGGPGGEGGDTDGSP